MNKRNKIIAQIGFYLLILGLMAYAAMRTLDFVQSTMPPDKSFWGYLFLLSTGVGAVIWLMVFLNLAEGAKQRAIAFLMGIVDLCGEMFLVYADTIRASAANGVTMTDQDMSIFVVASVLVISVNIIAGYAFHLFDPTAEQQSKARDLVDEVTEVALKDMNTPAAKQAMINELAPTLKAAIMDEVAAQVRAAAGQYVTRATDIRSVLDLPALPFTGASAPTANDLTRAIPVEVPRTYPADANYEHHCFHCQKPHHGTSLYCSDACEAAALREFQIGNAERLAALNAKAEPSAPTVATVPEVAVPAPAPFQDGLLSDGHISYGDRS